MIYRKRPAIARSVCSTLLLLKIVFNASILAKVVLQLPLRTVFLVIQMLISKTINALVLTAMNLSPALESAVKSSAKGFVIPAFPLLPQIAYLASSILSSQEQPNLLLVDVQMVSTSKTAHLLTV